MHQQWREDCAETERMSLVMKCVGRLVRSTCLLTVLASVVAAEAQPARVRQFPPGSVRRAEDLPAGRLRARIQGLPGPARERALARLRSFHFTEADLLSLDTDAEGGVFYVDDFHHEPGDDEIDSAPAEPIIAAASVPVSPFPPGLVFHSRPEAPNILYLNFAGEDVVGSAWNSSLGRASIPAVPFSTDGDYSTFSDAEQSAIKRIWQRVAEDYAPFNIDVTTERPATFGTRVAHALITRNTDANGNPNPSSTAGGVAYVNVFGSSSFLTTRPAWVYYNNLGNGESSTAEAASHEIGHNLGLSHDGTSSTSYYGGHGSGNTSWGPIMGTGYGRNVSQWSKGDYYTANNTQDDLAIIAGKVSYRTDDRGDSSATATPLVLNGTNIVSTTPDVDPSNSNPANKGVLERATDVDVFSFTSGYGTVSLTVNPSIMATSTRGGNLDILLELYDANGALVLSNNAASQTTAQIQTPLAAGTYYLHVRNAGTGDPFASSPTGYTGYASLGQYFISGYIPATGGAPPIVQLNATVNNPAWGTVNPSNATYVAGASAQVLATPVRYYRFVGWTNGAAGTSNPLSLTLNSNTALQAIFGEVLTATHPTPHWWLAAHGYTNNLEAAVSAIGANGMPLWQSYVAGLSPNDSADQLRIGLTRNANGNPVLTWNTVTGRVYTLWSSSSPGGAYTSVPGASNLPWTVQRFTNSLNAPGAVYYRLEVRKP